MFTTLLNVFTPSHMRVKPATAAAPVTANPSAWNQYFSEAWASTKAVWDVISLGLVHYNPEKTFNLGGAIPSAVRVVGNFAKTIGNFAAFQKHRYYQEEAEATASWNAASEDLNATASGANDLFWDGVKALENAGSAISHAALATEQGIPAAGATLGAIANTTCNAAGYLPQYSAAVVNQGVALASKACQAAEEIASLVSRLSSTTINV